MRHEMTRSVPGLSSAGRARSAPWRAIYSISPCHPCASHSSSRGSAAESSASPMPIAAKPSSCPHALMFAASAEVSMPADLKLPDEQATLQLGARLAAGAVPGRVLHLRGDLGSGKTTLVRGLLRALGYAGRVKSPTYTLVEVYSLSSLNLYHFDFYRFQDRAEWLNSGFRDYFNADSVCIVEWPERAADLLERPDLEVSLAFEASGRSASSRAESPAGQAWLSSLSPP